MTDTTPREHQINANLATRVRLHPLARRDDGDAWIVGRVEARTFVALPHIGVRAVDLLGRGLTAAQVSQHLTAETGDDIDVPAFINDLAGLGFVAGLDGRTLPSAEVPPATFPWLRPHHVRFTLSPLLPFLLGVLTTAAAVVLALRPDLLPTYRDLFWSPHGSLVIGFSAVTGWTLVLIHELAHLTTARAAGVPGTIRLGTRLQFLVMQTDISGIELAPRRHRMTAYLAGIAVNLAIAAAGIVTLAALPAGGITHRLLSATVLISLLSLPFQLMVFMRTDVYFVLQDLTGCRDLFHDGIRYTRYLAGRVGRVLAHGDAPAPADPSLLLSTKERRAVRLYSLVLVVGTTLCLAVLAAVTLPANVALLGRAATHVGPAHPTAENLDSVTVLTTLGGMHLLWAATWWRNHHSKRR